jgi:hypothetical protein
MLDTKIDLSIYSSDVINTPSGCFDTINGYVDCFAFSNSHNMNIYSDTYNHMEEYLADPSLRLCGEYILRRHIDNNDIPVVETVWHSLFR